jgi:hypothetical protein
LKKFTLFILSVGLLACGAEEPEAKEPKVTPALKTYFDEFQGDCQIHKAPCDFDGLVVQLGDLDRAKPEKAICSGKTVTVERTLTGNLRVYFYHVMGHCVLGRKDDSEESLTIMGRYGMNGQYPPGGPTPNFDPWRVAVKDLMTRSEPTTARNPLGFDIE